MAKSAIRAYPKNLGIPISGWIWAFPLARLTQVATRLFFIFSTKTTFKRHPHHKIKIFSSLINISGEIQWLQIQLPSHSPQIDAI